MNTQKYLYNHEVQLAIFQQLLTYETLLKEVCIMDISRPSPGMFWIYVYPAGHPEQAHSGGVDPLPITTAKHVDEAVARWWQSVPDYCKK